MNSTRLRKRAKQFIKMWAVKHKLLSRGFSMQSLQFLFIILQLFHIYPKEYVPIYKYSMYVYVKWVEFILRGVQIKDFNVLLHYVPAIEIIDRAERILSLNFTYEETQKQETRFGKLGNQYFLIRDSVCMREACGVQFTNERGDVLDFNVRVAKDGADAEPALLLQHFDEPHAVHALLRALGHFIVAAIVRHLHVRLQIHNARRCYGNYNNSQSRC